MLRNVTQNLDVNTVLNLRIPEKAGNFLTSWGLSDS